MDHGSWIEASAASAIPGQARLVAREEVSRLEPGGCRQFTIQLLENSGT